MAKQISKPTIILSGTIRSKISRIGLANLQIEAWDKDNLKDDLLGNAITDANGLFSIPIQQKKDSWNLKDRKPDIYFKIYTDGKLIHQTQDDIFWNINKDQTTIEIFIDMENRNNEKQNLVLGTITDKQQKPLANLIVKVYDKNMRSENELAQTITDKAGKYEAQWHPSQLTNKERKTADIAIKIFGNKNTLFFSSDIQDVRFNASAKEEINIVINEIITPEESEFEILVKEVSLLAGDVSIANLQEDETHQDISFLSKEIEVSANKIEHLVVAHRMQVHSKIDAAFFYALLRKDTLLHSNFTKTFRARLSVNLDSNIESLIYDAALTDPKKILTDINSAVKDFIVSPNVRKESNKNSTLLQRFRKQAEAYYAEGNQKKIVDKVISFVLNGKLAEAGKLFAENKTDLNSFFKKISSPAFAISGKPNPQMHADLEKLFGLKSTTNNNTKPSKKTPKENTPQQLAKLNKLAWVEKLTAEADSKKLNADEKNAISLTASSLVRKFEIEFPTIAFNAQLARQETPVLHNQTEIVNFLNKHEDFDLVNQPVDAFIKEKKLSKKETEIIATELNEVQRIFQLNGHFSKTMALRSQGFTSSQSIVAAGETRFVNDIAPKANIKQDEAKQIFKRASNINTAAMLIAGEMQHTISAIPIAALETTILEDKIKAVSKDFPNLKSLFKAGDTCACEHCRSVYSPAAYMVEALQFLENRSVIDIDTRITSVWSAEDILFERRPDLGEIDLSCENANTPVKYIDLVCEVLEEAIAHDAGIVLTMPFTVGTATDPLKGIIHDDLYNVLHGMNWPVTKEAIIYGTETATGTIATAPYYVRDKKLVAKIIEKPSGVFTIFRLRQTLSSAEELAAAPEYINENAYTLLRNNEFAFTLPFDLNHTEAKAYFDRFGISRAKLMEDFNVLSNPSQYEIAAEKLGLTNAERNLIVISRATIARQQSIWRAPAKWPAPIGDTTGDVSGNVLDYMKRVDHFLNKTGLGFKKLDLLLALKFIDPTKKMYIKNKDLSCETDKKEIAFLDIRALDRIHRFLRLQKKTNLSFEILDELIWQTKLGNKRLNNACLIKIANLINIAETTRLKIEELVGCFGEMPNRIIKDDVQAPLYYKVFVNKANNGFVEKMLLPENVNGTELLVTHQTSISVCLQLKGVDLIKLFVLLPTNKIDFKNLSTLYAASRLIKKLKLNVDDFLILKELIGINVFASPQEMLDFVHEVNRFKKSPLKAADVKFMLWHQSASLPNIDAKTKQLLKKIQKEYKANYVLNKSKFDSNLSAEEQKETLQNELSKLYKVEEADVKTFVSFIDGNWTDVAKAKTFANSKLFHFFETAEILDTIDDLDIAVLTKAGDIATYESDLVVLQNANKQLNIANKQLSNAVTPTEIAIANASIIIANAEITIANDVLAISEPVYNIASGKILLQTFLDAISFYQNKQGKQLILEQNLVAAFKVEETLTKTVLKYAKNKKSLLGVELISNILISDFCKIETDFLLPIDTTNFASQIEAIHLLGKIFPLINAFKLKNEVIAWYLEHNRSIGWFEWDDIPFETTHLKSSYKKYIDFAELVHLSKQFTPVANPADATNPISFLSIQKMLLVSSTTKSDFIGSLSLLTGYDNNDLNEIDTHFFSPFDITNYNKIENWNRLFSCGEDLRKLGTDLADVKSYIKPVLTASDVSTLRSNLKAKYDEDTWLGTLKEIMDVIRPQKRNALIAFILATNKDIKDENDLYDYFLVDTQMESCMPSSRIVMAHGVIQLFVQRCLMGLEPKSAADLETDKSWGQWKWMKNYRVWEANRKVFLYPENWLSPDLRDDKSYLFTEFENELQQNELTDFTAEEAIIKYLEKLDNIAFLEVMATWYQSDIKSMHVFARTKGGVPAIYYYRRFEQERYWTPWEKVELDITGDHLLAFVRNNRLTLAWPVFSEVPDPNQGAKLPDQSRTDEQPLEKPRRKLKIQLAISEFANKKWQPKKISEDGITPKFIIRDQITEYTTADLPRDIYNMLYFEFGEQIWFYIPGVPEEGSVEQFKIAGIFNITGCKGYPELYNDSYSELENFIPEANFPFPYLRSKLPDLTYDFYPDFRNTTAISQRYHEKNIRKIDDLSIRTGSSFFASLLKNEPNAFLNILKSTPGNFRISYPHQFTKMDFVSLSLQLFLSGAFNDKVNRFPNDRKKVIAKIPLGTLLPYFMEDSKHAYVIIPGIYGKSKNGLVNTYSKTGSNILSLIEMVEKFIYGIIEYEKNPNPDDLKILMEDLNKIVAEISSYKGLLSGELGYGEAFKNMYHPLVCALRSTMYKDGVDGLMKRDVQMQQTKFNFQTHYNPNPDAVPILNYKTASGLPSYSYPIEDVDFESDGSYSGYNWELFFHAPFLLATKLTKNQRFEESMKWFHYIFNPTGALAGNTPQKYWVTKPFFLNQDADYLSQRIDNLLTKVAGNSPTDIEDLKFAITQWRDKPFKPDVVARFRPVAYQKAVLMKYIDNLIEWGDYLFRQDAMESIVQATQMYILADKILGEKPRTIPPVIKPPYETYNQIKQKIDAFGNALISLENTIAAFSLPEHGNELPEPPPAPVTLSMLYFCIPQNDKMLEYWDRVADRLFKIRHCQNIEGVERSLALFAPPIDPDMLVKAASAGLDISSVIAGINAPTPYYRFNVLSQKATELAQEVRGLGSSLLQALEKKDAEAMSLLRSEMEIKVLNAVKDMKELQIKESNEQIEVLKRTKLVTEERFKFYKVIEKLNSDEQLSLNKLKESQNYQENAQVVKLTASIISLLPDIDLGASGFGGSPIAKFKIGGLNLGQASNAASDILSFLGMIASNESTRASIIGGHSRRWDDWKLQERTANLELKSIEKQLVAAEIRKEIAETDLKNHELQIDNAKKSDEFMRSKFTNKELYDWMIGQISSVYFSAYKLSHDFAKKAERSYRFELGNDDSFISYGYWDSMKKGLQSADHLIHDIKRMETSYLDKNKREYELTKHISLNMLDPLALIKLRATGVCDFDIPEVLFDMDHAGHYFRRIKSVSISLPCIAGPYTSVSAKLSLVNNRYRKNTNPGDEYAESLGDERFVYNIGAIQSIAASSSQNDSGVFELNFRDERYLPFEGTGAISSWRLELPTEVRQYDYNTIADVVMHIKYTAREGGSGLKTLANNSLRDRLANIKQQLSETGLHVAINLKHDMPNEWHMLMKSSAVQIKIDKSRLPYMAQDIETDTIVEVLFVAKVKDIDKDGAAVTTFFITAPSVAFAKNNDWNIWVSTNYSIALNTDFSLSSIKTDLDNLEELIMVVKYKINGFSLIYIC